jgi:hypothetical protein
MEKAVLRVDGISCDHFFNWIKSGSVIKTRRGRGKFTRISQKAVGNNQKSGKRG